MTDEQEILESARKHGGQHLLPRRFGRSYPPTEIDLEYDACERLCKSGRARWMGGGLAPGIRLTAKGAATSPA